MKVLKTIRTSKNTGEKLNVIPNNEISSYQKYDDFLFVDTERVFQKMLGFGGAFTEAAAHTLSKLSDDLRAEVIKMYFDPNEGLAYNLGRVHIHSCDFALGNYTYVEDDDKDLQSFDIKHDRELIMPLIKDSAAQSGKDLLLLASPWSPPAWMKTNHKMNGGGKLLETYRDSWAQYYGCL